MEGTTTLYVNDSIVDLYPDTAIEVIFQVNDLRNLQSRESTTSNQFSVPKTEKNMKIFEGIGTMRISDLPYTRPVARLFQDGIATIPAGYVEIVNVGDDIDIIVRGGNLTFTSLIEGQKIRDVSTMDALVTWEFAAMGFFFSNTNFIWRWVTMQYGPQSLTGNTIDIRYLPPSTSFWHLLRDIITDAGYTYSFPASIPTTAGSFLFDLCIPATDLELKRSDMVWDDYNFIATSNTTQTASHTGVGPSANRFDTIDLQVATPTSSLFTTPSGVFEDPGAQRTIRMRVKFTIENFSETATSGTANVDQIRLQVRDNNYAVNFLNVLLSGWSSGTNVYEYEVTYTTFTNSDLQLRLRTRTSGDPGTVDFSFDIKDVEWEFISDETISYGQNFKLKDTAPDISQIDIIKTYLNMFNATMYVDEVEKVVHFETYKAIAENKPFGPNWTDKIDLSVEPSISYKWGNYGQESVLKYDNDNFVNPLTGEDSLVISDAKLPQRVDAVQIPFSGSESEIIFSVNPQRVAKLPRYEFDADSNEWEAVNNLAPRLVRAVNTTGISFDIDDGDSTAAKTAMLRGVFVDPDITEMPGFDTYIKDEYYSEIETNLNEAKRVRLGVRLTTKDILDLREIDTQGKGFFTPVYIALTDPSRKIDLSGYFLINRIEYRPNGVSMVELTNV